MGAAAAGETPADTQDAVMNSIDDTTPVVSENTGGAEPLLGMSNEDNEILGADSGTFTELNTTIQNHDNSTPLELTKDYIFTSGDDENFTEGITITTNGLIIDGKNHIIDANGLARIFQVNANDLIIKNITFINGQSTNGGAININGNTIKIEYCNFTNNTADNTGGAIAITGGAENFNLDNCEFINNSAKFGAAIYSSGNCDIITLKRNTFENNSASGNQIIRCAFSNTIIENCTFKNNTVEGQYLVHILNAVNSTVKDCLFDSNQVSAGAIVALEMGNENTTATNLTFTNNNGGGAALAITTGNVSIINIENHNSTQGIFIGNNVVMSGVNINNSTFGGDLGGAVVSSRINNTISDVTISNTMGTAVNIVGDNVNITDVTISNTTGDAMVVSGGGANITSISVSNTTGTAMVVSGSGANITGISVSNTTGSPVVINGEDVSFSDSTVDEGKAESELELYYAGNDCLVAHLIGHGTGGVSAANPETLNMTNVRVWNGKEYVLISLDNTTKIDLINEPVTLKGIDGMNNLVILDTVLITNESGMVSYDFSNYALNPMTFVASFAGDDHYFNSTSLEYLIGLGGEFWLLQKYITDEIIKGNKYIKLNHTVNYTIGLDNMVNGIRIEEDNVVFDGDGYTIDAQGMSAILLLYGNNITVKNITFINGNSSTNLVDQFGFGSGYGAAINIKSVNCSVSDCIFMNNIAEQSAGGINLGYTSANTTINNCIFMNNVAHKNSGAVSLSGDNSTVTNSIFINNTADNNAGALYLTAAFNGTVINCTFINNSDLNNGGSVYVNALNSTIRNVTFINNTAFVQGGAIYINGNAKNLIISDSHFINNTAEAAGAIRCSADNVTMINCEFINSTSGGSGSAIYWYGANASVINCNFINNRATYGGAIIFKNNDGIVSGSRFINNTGSKDGGALQLDGETTLENCYFENNSAGANGGAINGKITSVVDSTFINNTATTNGGAILTTVSTSISGSHFYNNTARGGAGGAIIKNTNGAFDMSIVDCDFENNTASTQGGAVYWRYSSATAGVNNLINSNFINNTAGTNGGAILVDNAVHYLTIKSCYFKYNTAKTGYSGAMDAYSNNFKMDDCHFINNTAGTHSGALRLYSTNGTILNSEFINNTAGTDGGAIYSTNGNYRFIQECMFINNTAGAIGGAVRIAGSYAVIDLCDFINNTAGTDGGAFYSNGRGVGFTNSKFINNTAGRDGGAAYTPLRDESFKYDFGFGTGQVTYQLGENTDFINNTAGEKGGALYITNYGRTMTNYNFINNTAADGGAVYIAGTTANTFKESKFDRNNATGYGGAIYIKGATTLTLTDVILTRNRAGSLFTVTIDGTDATGHLDGLNTYFNAIYTESNMKSLTYTNLYYWNQSIGGCETVSGSKKDNAGVLTPLTDTYVNILVLNSTNPAIVNNTLVTNDGANVVYDYNTGFDYYNNGARVLFYFPGDNYYFDSGDSGTILAYGEFYHLQQYINEKIGELTQDNRIIILDKDYIYSVGVDNITDGIYIGVDNIVIDGNAFTVDAMGMSRIFNINANNVTLKNIRLINANANGDGGAVYINGSANVTNVKFINSTASGSGGALYVNGAANVTDSVVFINSTASGSGGALYVNGAANVTDSVEFINNTASSGGALYIIGDANVTNVKFINNTATVTSGNNGGSALFIDGSVNIIHVDFINNTANRYATLFIKNGDNSIISDSKFINNTGKAAVSAVWIETSTNIKISESQFIANDAGTGNSAIYITSTCDRPTVKDCDFINNTAGTYAGALRIECANATVFNCNFTDNTAGTYAGALFVSGVNGNVSDCNFINNTAGTYAGALHMNGANEIVFNCNFTDNTAGTNAGALNIGAANGNVSDCNFTNNFAKDNGGAIYMNGANSNVSDCRFTNNTAGTNAGGALYINVAGVNVVDSNFTDNTAPIGAGIWTNKANTLVNNSIFTGNNGTSHWGAAIGSNNANMIVNNSCFYNNIAIKGSDSNPTGVVYLSGATPTLNNCTFEDNEGNYTLYVSGANAIILKNTLSDNQADYTLYVSGANAIILDNTLSDNNVDYDLVIAGNGVNLTDNTMANYIYLQSGTIVSPTNVIILNNGTIDAYTGEEANITAVIFDDNNNHIIVSGLQFVLDDGTLINTVFDDEAVMSGVHSFMTSGEYNVTTNVNNKLLDVSVYTGIVNVTGENITVDDSILNVTADDIDYLENASVVLNITTRVNGNVNISIISYDNDYNTTWIISIDEFDPVTIYSNILDKNGNPIGVPNGYGYILNITDILDAGIYHVFVVLNNSGEMSQDHVMFTVNKINPNLNISVDDVSYGSPVVVNVTLPHGVENVTVTISNGTYSKMFDNVVLGEDISLAGLDAGVYNVTIVYPGDNNYYDNTTIVSFIVDAVEPEFNLTLDNVTITLGENTTLNIGLNPEVNTTVIVNVNGTEYTVDIVDGKGSQALDDLGVGVYDINVTVTDTHNFKGNLTSDNITLTVNKINTDLILLKK